MSKKSVVTEAQEIQLAIELIQLGARLQLLETEVSLSRERLLKLYKELRGMSPPKGMLPFSTDWFLTWQPNIHSSLFINIHKFLVQYAGATGIEAVMKAYKPERHAEPGLLRQVQGQVCCRHARPEQRLCLRPVPHAVARRQDPQIERGCHCSGGTRADVTGLQQQPTKGGMRIPPFCAL
jgi:hypothetical protein